MKDEIFQSPVLRRCLSEQQAYGYAVPAAIPKKGGFRCAKAMFINMLSLLLPIIYTAFISLGLPDSLLGSAWPSMQPALSVSLSYAGIVSTVIALGTVFSSLMSDRLTKKLGAGLVTAISVCMTAVALFGFSISGKFFLLCLFAIPYGLGAGAVDAALNNYVALHYSSRHMSWLHCFWGVGCMVGPLIMGAFLSNRNGWQSGYRIISIIQIVLTIILFFSLPLWKRQTQDTGATPAQTKPMKLGEVLRIRGVPYVLLAFFGYCGVETTAGLWASSYLVLQRGIDKQTAASFAALFFVGITAGRFLSGFVSNRIGDKNMIRIGLAVLTCGIFMVILPIRFAGLTLAGLVVTGLGCAPIYPSVIHATPNNFGRENSQALVGVQMASAYVGSTLVPPLFGLVAQYITVALYPYYLLLFAVLMIVMTELLNRKTGTV